MCELCDKCKCDVCENRRAGGESGLCSSLLDFEKYEFPFCIGDFSIIPFEVNLVVAGTYKTCLEVSISFKKKKKRVNKVKIISQTFSFSPSKNINIRETFNSLIEENALKWFLKHLTDERREIIIKAVEEGLRDYHKYVYYDVYYFVDKHDKKYFHPEKMNEKSTEILSELNII
jgi:hypothetical protein